MARLLVHVEGQTEEQFVYEMLAPHLYGCGFQSVGARLIGRRGSSGGIRGWPETSKNILNHLREDRGRYVTTMVDYYGLPQRDASAWPGRAEAPARPLGQRAEYVEQKMVEAIAAELDTDRFIPFVLFHEFEAILFSDCAAFCRAVGQSGVESAMEAIRDSYSSPEEINDSSETAPSKRILSLVPGYQKPLMGNVAALEIGLAQIRRECSHFNAWVGRLEGLAKPIESDGR